MILPADDLTEWVANRGDQLVLAWTPQVEKSTTWESAFAEALVSELHTAMVTTMTHGGAEAQFLKLIAQSNTGLDPASERAVAQRFYSVTLKLARASSRKREFDRSSAIMPLRRTSCVKDDKTDPGHLALDGVVLPCDHPFWERWSPPLGMDCRCDKVAMTRRDLERSKLVITSGDELAWREARLSSSWPHEFEPLLDFRSTSPTVEASPSSDRIDESGTEDGDVWEAVLDATSLADLRQRMNKTDRALNARASPERQSK
jgi:hypothetical protein